MNEKHLLVIALFCGVIGICVLAFLPETPPQTLEGIVLWTNGTTARIATCSPTWVQFEEATALEKDTCMEFIGRMQGTEFTVQSSQAHQLAYHHCLSPSK